MHAVTYSFFSKQARDAIDAWILMAESVSTAIVQETVSQILSGIVQKYEEKEESNANRNFEWLDMAHIKLEAALETSKKWQITDPSLLRWRRKLKRAAQRQSDDFFLSAEAESCIGARCSPESG